MPLAGKTCPCRKKASKSAALGVFFFLSSWEVAMGLQTEEETTIEIPEPEEVPTWPNQPEPVPA
jgi:hypothetical protein